MLVKNAFIKKSRMMIIINKLEVEICLYGFVRVNTSILFVNELI